MPGERMKPLSKRTLILLVTVLCVLVITVAAMIFYFSSETSTESSRTSRDVVRWLLQRYYPGFQELKAKQQRALIRQYQESVRKAAHGAEFLLLGMLLFLFMHGLRWRFAWLFAWVGGTLYACTDEWHQSLVDGRGPGFVDVAIDSGGVAVGILVGFLLLGIFHLIFGKPGHRQHRRIKDAG